jgi:hypothetical protein
MSTTRKRKVPQRRIPLAPPRFAGGDRVRVKYGVAYPDYADLPIDRDDRIRAIFGLTSNDPLPESNGRNLDRYHAYLAANLSFPFQAAFSREIGPFTTQRGKVSVVGLADRDGYCPEEVGLMFEVRHDGEQPTRLVEGWIMCRNGVLHLLSDVTDLSQPQPGHAGRFLPLRDLVLTNLDANRQLLKDFHYWLRGQAATRHQPPGREFLDGK